MRRSSKRPEASRNAAAEATGQETSAAPVARRPRLMVAGEFSAGKTQLINGLLGEKVLPSNVTATALPPIWLIAGRRAMLAVDTEGRTREIAALEEVAVEDTHYVVLSHPAPLLRQFEIIDTPGNSDPNIPSESWERMLDYADAVVWCTNATQAWRQSEKSVWNEMPARLLEQATVLITHADRITDARSSDRVQRRVKREAGKYFAHFLMASLIRPGDLDRIRAHLEKLTGGLEGCAGTDCAIVAEFAAAHPWTGAEAEVAPDVRKPSVAPRKVRSAKMARDEEAQGDTRAGAVADASAEEAAPEAAEPKGAETAAGDDTPSAEVHLFVPPSSDGADTSEGPARSLWQSLSKDIDRTDAEAVLACVDRLLDALDHQDDPPETNRDNNSVDRDAAPELVRSAMVRRKP